MMKMRQDKNVIDHTGAIYAENETELSWLIRNGVDYDEDETGQWLN